MVCSLYTFRKPNRDKIREDFRTCAPVSISSPRRAKRIREDHEAIAIFRLQHTDVMNSPLSFELEGFRYLCRKYPLSLSVGVGICLQTLNGHFGLSQCPNLSSCFEITRSRQL
ncbi:unnamed protein product [Amoebophrya sp. A120]|nr:unnamed protein product [Amoebophrya sp. A120]|eukprot:GSA120T00003738001.1